MEGEKKIKMVCIKTHITSKEKVFTATIVPISGIRCKVKIEICDTLQLVSTAYLS